MSLTEEKMKKKTKVHKATKTRSMLGGSAAKVNVHPELKRHKGAGYTGIQEELDLEAVVVFGRMNPPTRGHERLIESIEAISEAHANSGVVESYPILLLSKSVNEDNPLSYSKRLELTKEAFGDKVHVIEENEVKDFLSLFKFLEEYFDHVTICVGSDRFADVNRILEDYNGSEFTFQSYSVLLIERDADSDDMDMNISATNMRSLAEEKELEEFRLGLPKNLEHRAAEIMEDLCVSMEQQAYLKEEKNHLRRAAKAAIINRKT